MRVEVFFVFYFSPSPTHFAEKEKKKIFFFFFVREFVLRLPQFTNFFLVSLVIQFPWIDMKRGSTQVVLCRFFHRTDTWGVSPKQQKSK